MGFATMCVNTRFLESGARASSAAAQALGQTIRSSGGPEVSRPSEGDELILFSVDAELIERYLKEARAGIRFDRERDGFERHRAVLGFDYFQLNPRQRVAGHKRTATTQYPQGPQPLRTKQNLQP